MVNEREREYECECTFNGGATEYITVYALKLQNLIELVENEAKERCLQLASIETIVDVTDWE